ncbi:hypothetical protein [Microvirga sp. 17 mud 1-3]|uniref:hypothetical protein n=1 Tax=Microvirga sp. 17 mud 1-3 TaxID=2082949 RepID=UPI0013A571AA|nr:hypothetical protein [Microvirga sp. 17 mud 1-3]
MYVFGGRVYVANYSGHNILKGTVQGDEYWVEQVIKHPDMTSPENVAVDADGIAVADYDGEAILYFNHDGTLRWRRKLSVAHGVALAYGNVYGASLSPEGLVKLDPRTGDLLAQNTTYGQKGFIYPTAIFSVRDSTFPGDLAVIDANRGAVIFIDRDLNLIETFGRNSPHLWLRPYGGEILGNRMLVTDTEGRRLVWLTPGRDTMVAADHGQRIHAGHAQERGADGAQCAYIPLPRAPGIPQDIALRGGWQGGCVVQDGKTTSPTVIFPRNSFLGWRPTIYFNALWGATVEKDGQSYTIYGSPSRSIYMVTDGSDYVFVPQDPRLVIWGPDGAEAELRRITEDAQSDLAALKASSERCGRLTAFLRYGDVKGEDLATTLSNITVYPSAKALAERWIKGEQITDQSIDDLARSAAGGIYISIDDIAMLRRMVGTTYESEAARFRACK